MRGLAKQCMGSHYGHRTYDKNQSPAFVTSREALSITRRRQLRAALSHATALFSPSIAASSISALSSPLFIITSAGTIHNPSSVMASIDELIDEPAAKCMLLPRQGSAARR